jgi:hypothetical protein
VGPGTGNAYSGSNAFDGHAFTQDFFARLAHNPGGSAVSWLGALDFHWYPGYDIFDPAQALRTPAQMGGFAQSLRGWMSEAGIPPVPIMMSEYNFTPMAPVLLNQLSNGLWLADWLGEYIRYFGAGGFSNFWDVCNGSDDHQDATQGDQGFWDMAGSPGQPLAAYWAMKMMAADWAIAGDDHPHRLVESSVHDWTGLLKVYSDRRPDGVLSLLVVNQDPAKSYYAQVHLQNFIPASKAREWTFDSSNYAWQTRTQPYDADPDKPPDFHTLSGIGTSFPAIFKPYSITVIQLDPATSPDKTDERPPVP